MPFSPVPPSSLSPTDGSILVLGAGELGMSVLRNLSKHVALHPGTALTVLLRPATLESNDPAKRRDLAAIRSLGVHVLPGDIAASSVEELSSQFRRFHTVISCTGFVGGSGTQTKLARAALDAQVRRYLPWQFGVDYDVIGRGSAQDLFNEQLDVRDLLRAQNQTEWIIVSTGMFTSFLFEPSFGVVDLPANPVHALGSWDNAVTVTTAEDIGALTAEIVFAEPPLQNQVVYTAGDTLTYGRLADLVDTVLGRKANREEWSVAHLEDDLVKDPGNALKKYRVVFAKGSGVAWNMANTFNAQRSLATTDVEGWMRANLDAGKSKTGEQAA